MEEKIIQIQLPGDKLVRKRVLTDNQALLIWMEELGESHDLKPGDKYAYLLDADDVEHNNFKTLKPEVIYRLPAIRKKQKREESLEELINAQKFDAAFLQLEKNSSNFMGDGEEQDDEICSPVKVQHTWKGHNQVLVTSLRDVCSKLQLNIKTEPEGNRTARVVGIRLGSGCGKSHLLSEAPRILNHCGIYITYNLDQNLSHDIDNPEKTTALRILLRLAKIPNKECPRFFESKIGSSILSINARILRQFAVYQLGKIDSPTFIGVDEIMELKDLQKIKIVISELGSIATECFEENRHQAVAVFVTSLRSAPFSTANGRPILPWSPPVPDESAVDTVLEQYLKGRDLDSCKALVISAAGFHFRSMVFAARAIGKELEPKVSSVLLDVDERWKSRIGNFAGLCQDIRNYVVDCCNGVDSGSQPDRRIQHLEEYLDFAEALPPPLICGAFGVMNDAGIHREHPLFGLFNCEFAFTDPAKHLKQFGAYYDFLRSSMNLPVIAGKVNVVVPIKAGKRRAREWFYKLRYPDGMTKSAESLFKIRERKPVTTDEAIDISPTKYYAPSATQHPLIDRAFVASSSGEQAVVLIQDKLNNDVPKAVRDLNTAANLIRTQNNKMEVLCIVNVIGARNATTAQDWLEHPYILVREDALDSFYSVNFSGVARFARQRKEWTA